VATRSQLPLLTRRGSPHSQGKQASGDCERGMRITSGIDFLLGKNKFWMDDEFPGFSGKLEIVLTLRVQNRSLFA
jgi:hypothetical protein